MNKITVSIIGGSGYAGGELLRILLGHPNVEIKQVTSRKFARFPMTVAHPNLRGVTDLKFVRPDQIESCDLLFLAMPNGESQKEMERYMELAERIIDLGADYRLRDQNMYENWYGEHANFALGEKFVYGLAEIYRDELVNAKYVSCAGCEATCAILGLYPLYKHGLVTNPHTVIDAKIGSSAAGLKASSSTHHPERAGVVRSYKPTGHRHTAEIQQEMSTASGNDVQVNMSATAIELVRGVLTTSHVFLDEDLSESEIWDVYKETYTDEPFVRLIRERMGLYRVPEPKLIAGTNFCDITIEKDRLSNRVVVISAIDNLVKGTAGQAVQAMNIMYGLEETTGLNFIGLHPV